MCSKLAYLSVALIVAGCARMTGDSMPIAPLPEGSARSIEGYATDVARYCASTGGKYTLTSTPTARVERGTCEFSGGKRCDANAYYRGECARE